HPNSHSVPKAMRMLNMRKLALATVVVSLLAGVSALAWARAKKPAAAAGNQSWSVKADYIEACSCHLFCTCYFNSGPEGAHHCEFNNAVKITEGHVAGVKVDGIKFW